jgi:hypothetical protein
LFFLLSAKAKAFHEASYGLQTLAHANNAVLASPPLPMLYMKAGVGQLSVQYAPFSGSIDSTLNGFRTAGDVKGNGAALSYNKALSDSLGFYLLAAFNQLTGDFSYTGPTNDKTYMRDIEAQATNIGLGINWNFIGGSESDFFTAGLILGGASENISMTQRIVSINNSSTTTDDFKMKTNPADPTMMVGLQAGLKLGGFIVNPYFIGVTGFSDSDCRDYTVTETTVNGPMVGQSSSSCSGQNKILLKTGFTAMGIRLHYQPLGISLNAVSFPSEPSESELKPLKLNLVMIAISL